MFPNFGLMLTLEKNSSKTTVLLFKKAVKWNLYIWYNIVIQAGHEISSILTEVESCASPILTATTCCTTTVKPT